MKSWSVLIFVHHPCRHQGRPLGGGIGHADFCFTTALILKKTHFSPQISNKILKSQKESLWACTRFLLFFFSKKDLVLYPYGKTYQWTTGQQVLGSVTRSRDLTVFVRPGPCILQLQLHTQVVTRYCEQAGVSRSLTHADCPL